MSARSKSSEEFHRRRRRGTTKAIRRKRCCEWRQEGIPATNADCVSAKYQDEATGDATDEHIEQDWREHDEDPVPGKRLELEQCAYRPLDCARNDGGSNKDEFQF